MVKKKSSTSKKVIPPLTKGLLTKYGYALKNTKDNRHKSLDKAVKGYDKLEVIRHLNAIRTLQKSNEKNWKKLDNDMKYIQKKYFKEQEGWKHSSATMKKKRGRPKKTSTGRKKTATKKRASTGRKKAATTRKRASTGRKKTVTTRKRASTGRKKATTRKRASTGRKKTATAKKRASTGHKKATGKK